MNKRNGYLKAYEKQTLLVYRDESRRQRGGTLEGKEKLSI